MMAPSLAEQARTALAAGLTATLAAVDHDGRPLLMRVAILDDGSGAPVTVLSNLAPITLRARQDARAGMSIGDRLVLQGDLAPVPGLQQLALQPALIAAHPHLTRPMESLDYSWLRLVPSRVQWLDDDGTAHWLIPADLANAEPDPLSGLDEFGGDRQRVLVDEISDRLGDDLLLMVQGLVGRWRATWARLTSVDRYGLVVELAEPPGNSVTRVPFPKRLDSVGDLHAAIAGLRSSAMETPTAKSQGRGAPRQQPRPSAGPTATELLEAMETTTVEDEGPETPELLEPTEDDYSWALWPSPDDSAFAGDASPLEGVEGDGGGGADVDGVDVPRHRNTYSLMDSLERAGREARALAAQQEGDALVAFDDQLGDVEGFTTGDVGVAGRERDEPDTGVTQDVEPLGEGVQPSVGEGVGLTHGDTA